MNATECRLNIHDGTERQFGHATDLAYKNQMETLHLPFLYGCLHDQRFRVNVKFFC